MPGAGAPTGGWYVNALRAVQPTGARGVSAKGSGRVIQQAFVAQRGGTFQYAVQGGARNAELARRGRHVVLVAPQRAADGLQLGMRPGLVQRDVAGVRHPFFQPQILGRQQRVFAHDHGAAHPVDQFAHVAGPVVIAHHAQGDLQTTPGPTVDYEFVAEHLKELFGKHDIRKIAFDRWNWRHLKPWLQKAGFTDEQLDGDNAVFEPFGQGTSSMSPALRDLEGILLNKRLVHGGHPVLTMCMMNATVRPDPSGNRKLDKQKSRGRIDGAVALAMAAAMAGTYEDTASGPSFWEVLDPGEAQ